MYKNKLITVAITILILTGCNLVKSNPGEDTILKTPSSTESQTDAIELNPNNKKSFSNGPYSIFTANYDGTNLKEIYNGASLYAQTKVSPNEKQIVFTVYTSDFNHDGYFNNDDIKETEIGVMNIDGTEIKMLTKNKEIVDFTPTWKADGQAIIFSSSRDSSRHFLNLELYEMNTDGKNVKRLTTTSGYAETWPSVSNNNLLYARHSLYHPTENAGIYQARLDNKDRTQIISANIENISLTSTALGDYFPIANNTSQEIAFSRHLNDDLVFDKEITGDYDVYITNIETSEILNLAPEKDAALYPAFDLFDRSLVYLSLEKTTIGEKKTNIVTVKKDGSDKRIFSVPDNIEILYLCPFPSTDLQTLDQTPDLIIAGRKNF